MAFGIIKGLVLEEKGGKESFEAYDVDDTNLLRCLCRCRCRCVCTVFTDHRMSSGGSRSAPEMFHLP